MLRALADFEFGVEFARVCPLNDDLSLPTPDYDPATTIGGVIGGAGPFDFSGYATPAAVPLTIKFDNGAEETVNVNLDEVADIEAVTVAELVAAITLAGPTDVTASLIVATGRLLFEYTGTDVVIFMQVYGALAIGAEIGQGYGIQYLLFDTLKSFVTTPRMKDSETIATTDARGRDTEIITDEYRKGFQAAMIDTAQDWYLLALIEGGYNDPDEGYEAPTSESKKAYFFIDLFTRDYNEGENLESALEGYFHYLFRKCKGIVGDLNHERGWADGNYTITGTSYLEKDGTLYGDYHKQRLTIEQYQALDVENT